MSHVEDSALTGSLANEENVEQSGEVEFSEGDSDGQLITCQETLVIYSCDLCGVEFLSVSLLKKHMTDHEQGKLHKLVARGEIFSGSVDLERNLARHTELKTFIDNTMLSGQEINNHFPCYECDQSFSRRCDWKRHKLTHRGKKSKRSKPNSKSNKTLDEKIKNPLTGKGFTCRKCGEHFVIRRELRKHVSLVHNSQNPHICLECGRSFFQIAHFKSHAKTHTRVKPPPKSKKSYLCKDCGMGFIRKEELTAHKEIHRPGYSVDSEQIGGKVAFDGGSEDIDALLDRPVTLETFGKACDKDLQPPTLLEAHVKKHDGKSPSRCLDSVETYSSPSNLQQHMDIHNRKSQSNIMETLESAHTSGNNANGKKFTCKKCGEHFGIRYELRKHVSLVHNGRSMHDCPECSRSFYQISHWKSHMKRHTKNKEKAKICDVCGMHFAGKTLFNRHMKAHEKANVNSHFCRECDASFKHKEDLACHMEFHKGKTLHICAECHRSFFDVKDLNIHLKSHEVNMFCTICGADFDREKKLKTHMQTHKQKQRVNETSSGNGASAKNTKDDTERPFACKKCGERFVLHYDLRKHIGVIHNGAALHICSECGWTFFQISHLRSHMNTHNREKPYTCKECGVNFAWKKNWKVHMKAHKAEKELKIDDENFTVSTDKKDDTEITGSGEANITVSVVVDRVDSMGAIGAGADGPRCGGDIGSNESNVGVVIKGGAYEPSIATVSAGVIGLEASGPSSAKVIGPNESNTRTVIEVGTGTLNTTTVSAGVIGAEACGPSSAKVIGPDESNTRTVIEDGTDTLNTTTVSAGVIEAEASGPSSAVVIGPDESNERAVIESGTDRLDTTVVSRADGTEATEVIGVKEAASDAEVDASSDEADDATVILTRPDEPISAAVTSADETEATMVIATGVVWAEASEPGGAAIEGETGKSNTTAVFGADEIDEMALEANGSSYAFTFETDEIGAAVITEVGADEPDDTVLFGADAATMIGAGKADSSKIVDTSVVLNVDETDSAAETVTDEPNTAALIGAGADKTGVIEIRASEPNALALIGTSTNERSTIAKIGADEPSGLQAGGTADDETDTAVENGAGELNATAICGKSFWISDLRPHKRSHDSMKVYVCKECTACFGTNGDLVRHMEAHEEVLAKDGEVMEPPHSSDSAVVIPLPVQCDESDASSTNDENTSKNSKFLRILAGTDRKKSIRFSLKDVFGRQKITIFCRKSEEPYICKDFGGDFTHEEELTEHAETHKEEIDSDIVVSDTALNFEASPARSELDLSTFCEICRKDFALLPVFEAHMKKHEGKSFLQCYECDEIFSRQHGFSKHIETHEKKELSPGNQDSTSKDTKKDLGGDTYACEKCGLSFGSRENLRGHKRMIHNNKSPYVCSDCGKCFFLIANLKKHRRNHAREESHVCKECGACFAYDKELVKHKEIHTVDLQHLAVVELERLPVVEQALHQSVAEKSQPEVAFSCAVCGDGFVSRSAMRKHARSAHKGKSQHIYSECGRIFRWDSYLKSREKTHGKEDFEFGRPGKTYGKDSNSRWPRRTELRNSRKAHDTANSEFRRPRKTLDKKNSELRGIRMTHKEHSGLRRLRKARDKEDSASSRTGRVLDEYSEPRTLRKASTKKESHVCEDRGTSFGSKKNLTKHMRVYQSNVYIEDEQDDNNSTNKEYIPEKSHHKMRKRSSRNISLKRDKVTGGFGCKKCDKRFVLHYELRKHITFDHNGGTIPICSECGKKFFQTSHLRQHIKIHAKKKRQVCDDCGEAFLLQKELKAHKKQHRLQQCAETGDCSDNHVASTPILTNSEQKQFEGVGCTGDIESGQPKRVENAENGRNSAPDVENQLQSRTENDQVVSPKNVVLHECKRCGGGFASFYELRKHKGLVHNGKSLHACPECGRKFFEKSHLKSHVKTHTKDTPINRYICEGCGESFKLKQQLVNHQLIRKKKSYICSICEEGFATKIEYISHNQIHTQKGSDLLEQCVAIAQISDKDSEKQGQNEKDESNQSFTIDKNLPQDVSDGRFPCKKCNKRFALRYEVRKHCRLVHNGGSIYACPDCGRNFFQISHLKSHIKIHTKRPSHPCEECGAHFTWEKDLTRHKREVHQPEPDMEQVFTKNFEKYTCEKHEERFSTPYELRKRDGLVHSRESVCFCSLCRRVFSQISLLKSHEKTHVREKLTCWVCKETFQSKKELDEHTKSHSNVNPYVCTECGVSFGNDGDLTAHMGFHVEDQEGELSESSVIQSERKRKIGEADHDSTYDVDPKQRKTNTNRSKRRRIPDSGSRQCDVCGKLFQKYHSCLKRTVLY